MKNVTYHNPINQEENTPLVTILETKIDSKQSTAVDSRQSPYVIDLAKSSFGGIYYPIPGTQWYLKKISGVWTLMARAPQQNPQLDPSLVPVVGDTYIGSEGATHVVSDLGVVGDLTVAGSVFLPNGTKQVNIGGSASTAAIAQKLASVATDALSLRVTTDAFDRYTINADGKQEWSDGSGAADVNLYRSTTDTLATDDNILLTDNSRTVNIGGSGSSAKFSAKLALVTNLLTSVRVTTDAANRMQIDGNGKIEWGDGTNAVDTNLYRTSSDVLKTDDSFIIVGSLTVLGDASNVLPKANGVNALATTSGTNTTTSATYVNMAGTGSQTSFSITKKFGSSSSRLLIFMSGSFFTSASATGSFFAVLVNGTDYQTAAVAANTSLNVHQDFSGAVLITDPLAAGTYTVQGRWRCQNGVSTISRDTSDWLSINAIEIAI